MSGLFHRHRWSTVDAQQGEFAVFRSEGTWLLQRCDECGRFRVETLDGHWPIEAFRNDKQPVPPEPASPEAT